MHRALRSWSHVVVMRPVSWSSQSRVTAQSVGDVLGRIVVPCPVLTFSGQSKTRHCLQTCYVVRVSLFFPHMNGETEAQMLIRWVKPFKPLNIPKVSPDSKCAALLLWTLQSLSEFGSAQGLASP